MANSQSNLKRTFGTPTTAHTWTLSFWYKHGGQTASADTVLSVNAPTTNNQIWLGGSDTCELNMYTEGYLFTTTRKLRDTGWYHFVVAVNSNASGSNKIRVYINGTEETSFSTDNRSTWNTANSKFNGAYDHLLGANNAANYVNGNLSDVHFVDGLQLDPSYFGRTNSLRNNQWVPKHPTAIRTAIAGAGGFGNNGFQLLFNRMTDGTTTNNECTNFGNVTFMQAFRNGNTTTFDVQGSGSTVGTLTYQSTGGPKGNAYATGWTQGSTASSTSGSVGYQTGDTGVFTSWTTGRTWMAWIKSTDSGSRSGQWRVRVNAFGDYRGSVYGGFGLDGGKVAFGADTVLSGSTTLSDGNWHHIAMTYDGGGGTTGIFKLYADGKLEKTFRADNIGSTAQASIRLDCVGFTYAYGEAVPSAMDGIAVYPYELSAQQINVVYNGNTYYFNDYSGRANDWYSGYGPIYTSQDTPTNNFISINPYNKINCSLYEGGTRVVTGGNNVSYWLNHGFTSGKWYWEVKKNYGDMSFVLTNDGYGNIAWPTHSPSLTANLYYTSEGTGTNRYALNNTAVAMPSGWGDDLDGDIYSFALDMDASPPTLIVKHNNVSGTATTITLTSAFKDQPLKFGNTYTTSWPNIELIFNTGQGTFVTSNNGAGYADANGRGKFQYSVPSGYLSLCEDNIANPTDAAISPQNHVKALTYTGDNTAARVITGVGFRPGLVILKNRDNTYYAQMHDSVRGATAGAIYTGTNTLTQDASYPLSSFDADGFTTKNATGTNSQNGSGERISAWCWKAGDSITTNTAGSITSNVSVNSAAGFSIVKYNASASPATIGHGLPSAPHFIIIRGGYDSQTYNFDVYHKDLGPTKRLLLNSTSVAETTSGPWNNTAPTSTVINQGNAWYAGGVNNIAYCWTEVPGFSRFGSYIYNNNTDGNYIYLGFKPAIILIKNTDNTEQWYIVDNARNTINGNQTAFLQMGTNTESASNSQATDSRIDFLSNGFKLRDLNSVASGEVTFGSRNYIYAAWAESPFKYSNSK